MCCFLIFFFTILVVKENATLKLALDLPTDAPITLANEAVATSSFLAHKTVKDLSKLPKAEIYLLSLLLILCLSQISAI